MHWKKFYFIFDIINKTPSSIYICEGFFYILVFIKFNLLTPSIIAENINVEIMLYAKKGIAKV